MLVPVVNPIESGTILVVSVGSLNLSISHPCVGDQFSDPKRKSLLEINSLIPMVLDHDYIPHTYKIVGTQFCDTLSHPSLEV
jgi:hypothetical protein